MDPRIAWIKKLEQHPELAYSHGPDRFRIEPPSSSGFAVELCSDNGQWTVFLGNAGFHEAFTSSEEVSNFIAWCYSGAARVREVWRGRAPQKAILEAYENGQWRQVSETRFILVPFWRERREVVLENPNLLKTWGTAKICFPPIADGRGTAKTFDLPGGT
jgi:hypothetical protein